MRTGFGEHLLAGALLLVAMLLILGVPSGTELPLAAAFFLAGAVIPDLDSPVSKPRRMMRRVVFLSALLLVVMLYPEMEATCERIAGSSSCSLLPLLAVLLAFGILYVVDSLVPRHRGFLHSVSAAVLYGAFSCLLVVYLRLGSLEIGGWAFCGYLSHLAVDAAGDAIPFK